jgi:putative copper export protein
MHGVMLLLHVLGATVWTGGHLVLALTLLPRALSNRSVEELRQFESAYEWVGIPALLLQVITGTWLAFGDPVSRLIGIKLLLLAITVAFAADARLRVIPRLTAERLGSLAWHVVPVTLVSVLYVVVGVSFRTGWLY